MFLLAYAIHFEIFISYPETTNLLTISIFTFNLLMREVILKMSKSPGKRDERYSNPFDQSWYKNAYRCEECGIIQIEMSCSNQGGIFPCGICGRMMAVTASVILTILTAIQKHFERSLIS